jgi:hypothetical protein
VRNGGQGLAYRVRGWVKWDHTGREDNYVWQTVPILPTTIAAGETQDARLDSTGVEDWDRAYGVLDYEDVTGMAWRTYFEFESDSEGRLFVNVRQIDERWRTGDPPEGRTEIPNPVPDDWQPGPPLPPAGTFPDPWRRPPWRKRLERWWFLRRHGWHKGGV